MVSVADLYDAAERAGMLTPVTKGAQTVACVFRAPDETVLEGLMLSRAYELEYPTARLTLASGDIVTINGVQYRVREVRAVRDGSECRASLERL